MTDPTEQTGPPRWPEPSVYTVAMSTQPELNGVKNMLWVLGINPDMAAAHLAEDLAIAARARACASDERFDNVDGPDGRTFYTPERLLAYLLNGEQP